MSSITKMFKGSVLAALLAGSGAAVADVQCGGGIAEDANKILHTNTNYCPAKKVTIDDLNSAVKHSPVVHVGQQDAKTVVLVEAPKHCPVAAQGIDDLIGKKPAYCPTLKL